MSKINKKTNKPEKGWSFNVSQKKFIIITLLFIFLAANQLNAGSGKTFYVWDKNGSDTGNGLSLNTAFKTIGKAAEKVSPGDTVLIKGGVYRETVKLTRAGKKDSPIIFKAIPDETVVVTWGWEEKGWVKTPGTRFCYEKNFPYLPYMVWEKKTLTRYLGLNDRTILDRQPGSFFIDRKQRKLYIHTLDGRMPENSGIVVIPRFVKGAPAPVDSTKKFGWWHRFHAGININTDYNSVEGLSVAFWPLGILDGLAVGKPVTYTGNSILNNTIYGCSCGISVARGAQEALVENNLVFRNSGPGIVVGLNFYNNSYIRDVLIKRNRLFNNGPSLPFRDQENAAAGHPFSLSKYGKNVNNVDFLDNLVVLDEPSRGFGVMRCKGGVDGDMKLIGNVFVGGGPRFYAPKAAGKHIFNNNTLIGSGTGYVQRGTIEYRKKSGYKPEMKNNLYLKNNRIRAGFADPAFYDYRLWRTSRCLGRGAYPRPEPVLYVAPNGRGDGSNPKKALSELGAALKKLSSGGTVYLLPGTYREKLTFSAESAKTGLSIRNYGKGEVIFSDSTLALCAFRELNINGLIFRNTRLEVTGNENIEFKYCVFDSGNPAIKMANCGKLKFINNTFINGSTGIEAGSAVVVLRNNLFTNAAEPLRLVGTGRIVSENNCFTGKKAKTVAAAWNRQHAGAFPAFAANETLNADYTLPDGTLQFAGLGCTFIGARKHNTFSTPLIIEKLRVSNVLPDQAVISWETPYAYPNVELTLKNAKGKTIRNREIKQGRYGKTVSAVCLRELEPNTPYMASLLFSCAGKTVVEKSIKFKTSKKTESVPRTIYISPFGKENGDGLSPAGAVRQLQTALNLARPGDTLLVAPGIYTEQLDVFINGLSPEKPLTIRSEKPGKAVLNANFLFDFVLRINNGRHIVVDGFKIDGLRYATGSGIVLEKCNDITIKNCLFARNSPFPGTGLSNQHIRVISSKHINVNHCIFDSGFHSIWMSSCDRVSIFNNTFWNNGISSVYVGCSPAAEVKIYNNIFMDVTTGHHSPAAATAASGPKILCDYNLYWKTAYNPQMRFYGVGGNNLPGSAPWHVKTKDSPETIEGVREKYGMEKHGQFADPLFINPKYGDFRLKAGSPALGKGRNGANIGANADIFIK